MRPNKKSLFQNSRGGLRIRSNGFRFPDRSPFPCRFRPKSLSGGLVKTNLSIFPPLGHLCRLERADPEATTAFRDEEAAWPSWPRFHTSDARTPSLDPEPGDAPLCQARKSNPRVKPIFLYRLSLRHSAILRRVWQALGLVSRPIRGRRHRKRRDCTFGPVEG